VHLETMSKSRLLFFVLLLLLLIANVSAFDHPGDDFDQAWDDMQRATDFDCSYDPRDD
jgi:hypothetical protein